jgi:hypothetical protein
MLYCNNATSFYLTMKLTSTPQDGAMPSLNSLFTASAGLRCGIAILLLTILWLGIYWAVALP